MKVDELFEYLDYLEFNKDDADKFVLFLYLLDESLRLEKNIFLEHFDVSFLKKLSDAKVVFIDSKYIKYIGFKFKDQKEV